jgi:hypothetical protein
MQTRIPICKFLAINPCMQNRDQQGSPHANICSIWGSGDPNLHMHATTICIPFLQVTGLSPFGDSPFAYSRCLHMVIKIDTYLDHLTFDQALGLCTWDQIVVVQTDQSNKCQHLTQVQITLTATRDWINLTTSASAHLLRYKKPKCWVPPNTKYMMLEDVVWWPVWYVVCNSKKCNLFN